MLFEDPAVQEILHRIVWRLSDRPAWLEDLMQEAVIHLWRSECQRPGQSLSWYLQGCRFHLMHQLKSGKSLDSPKRYWRLTDLSEESDRESWNSGNDLEATIDQQINARDMTSLLLDRLSPPEKIVLRLLLEGFGVREIARKTRVSHPAVIRRRHKIARLAMTLGICPSRYYRKAFRRATCSRAASEAVATGV